MTNKTVEYSVACKRCGSPIGYSGMMYERMKEFGHSRPEYCEDCRKILIAEKMTMGAAYYSLETLPGVDANDEAIPGELGKVYHPDRPHVKVEKEKVFDASNFGATPDKIVEIYEWLKDPKHQVAIVEGGTGSGKSTALPYWLIFPPEGVPSDFFIRDGQIVITQPRILATTGVSKYLGKLMGSTVGKGFDIGYRYSKDRNADRFNAAFMATDGSLINMIKMGQLSDLSVVMIDEAHEMSINIAIILYLLRDLLPLYPHLKVLIVSATINAKAFLDHFGEETATLVSFEPKSIYSYVVNYADEKDRLPYDNLNRLKRSIVPATVKLTTWLLKEQVSGRKKRGHVLAFLQGVRPINEAVDLLRSEIASDPSLKDQVVVYPLYSDLSEEESDLAVEDSDPSKIKVIVCTNVAEASITVKGTVYVVETGIENQAQWEVEAGSKSVELRTISKANAKQRWGRSGRVCDGEVFCTYTESQFNEMLDYPVPAIQRCSMEEIILRLKELGVDDFENGWIDAPVQAELDRSLASLKNSGALDERNMLTSYGAMLSQFQYPSGLVNLIMMADRYGCAVEVATLLPIIKDGGYKNLLVRDPKWDQATVQKVSMIHQVLFDGVKDDVEFILKLFSLWLSPPEINKDDKHKRTSLKERRDAWAEAFYVNFDAFSESIIPERDQILRLLNSHKKSRNFRDINLALIDRVRVVLSFCLPYLTTVEDSYVYNSRPESNPAESAFCQVSMSADRKKAVESTKNGSPLSLAKELVVWEKQSEPLDSVRVRLLEDINLPLFGTETYDRFAEMFSVGDEVSVSVTGYFEQPGSRNTCLVVQEPKSGYEVWLNPMDVSFTQSSAVIKEIPVGTNIRVKVRSMDSDQKSVRLFCLPIIESAVKKIFADGKKVDGQLVTRAKVIEIRRDGKVVFVAELSKPEEGLVLVVHSRERSLFKPMDQFNVGETYQVSFSLPRVDWEFGANLTSASDKLRKAVLDPNCGLNFSNSKLSFKGQMSFEKYWELIDIDDDKSFQEALEYLFASSNMLWARGVASADWAEEISSRYPMNSVISVTVKSIFKIGALVSVEDGLDGFVHISKINNSRRVDNVSNALVVGSEVKGRVIGYEPGRQQLSLSLAIPENSPMNRLSVGEEIVGVVSGMNDYGAFVEIGLGYSGMIHKSKMGARVNFPKDILSVGDSLTVRILEIKEDKRGYRVSLALVRKNT